MLLCLFDLSHLRTEDVHQRLFLESEHSFRVLDIRQQSSLVCCLASSQESDPLLDSQELFVLRLDASGFLSFFFRSRAAKSLHLLQQIALPRGSSAPRAFLPITTTLPPVSPVEFGVEKGADDDNDNDNEIENEEIDYENAIENENANEMQIKLDTHDKLESKPDQKPHPAPLSSASSASCCAAYTAG